MKFQCFNLTLIRYWESLGEVGRTRWNIYVPSLGWIVLRPCFFAGMWWECQICFCFVRFSSRVLASPAPGVGTTVEVPLQERGRCRTLSRQSWGRPPGVRLHHHNITTERRHHRKKGEDTERKLGKNVPGHEARFQAPSTLDLNGFHL